jgi:hypothetical protein
MKFAGAVQEGNQHSNYNCVEMLGTVVRRDAAGQPGDRRSSEAEAGYRNENLRVEK